MNNRQDMMNQWLADALQVPPHAPVPLAGDASFRRYFRITTDDASYVLMDAPPGKEDCRPFVEINRQLAAHRIHVPKIHAADLDKGFLLLEDFGDALFLNVLSQRQLADTLYRQAIDTLVNIQNVDCRQLPPFDTQLLNDEMHLFVEWYCHRHLGVDFTQSDRQVLAEAFETLTQNALSQPQVFVHRDYHSRNLVALRDGDVGVLDYQDAVSGPVSYDLVSLLKDCYIRLPAKQIHSLINYFLTHPRRQGPALPSEKFTVWFDWMGIQRHLKAIGIFARLCHRDDKPAYLQDIPRTLNYVHECTERYTQLSDFHHLLKQLPAPQ